MIKENIIWINDAEVLNDFCLALTFNDGSKKIFDCKPLINKDSRYRVLQEKDNFKNFILDGWTITWMGGTIDIAPEYLYQESI
ncbi:MAG: DUF2442 domain-containing protein [Phocaeicola sp.]|nr:DUF2442 domain-containing protein [Phocaeicola sp.]